MRPRLLRLFAFVSLIAVALVVACAKPQPPKVVPKAAQVTSVDAQGINLELTVEMTNPNGFTLAVQSITGRVVIGGQTDLGEVRVPHAVSLPPSTPVSVVVPMTIRWSGASILAASALRGEDLPFTVQGSVGVGGEKLNVDVPFSMSGVVTRAQLEKAAMNSLQKLQLPSGLQLPTGAPTTK